MPKDVTPGTSNLQKFTSFTELFPDAEPEILLGDSEAVCGNELEIKGDPGIGMDYFWTVSNPAIHLDDHLDSNTMASVSGNFDRQTGYLRFFSFSPGCKNIPGYTPASDSVKISFFEQPAPVELADSSADIYITDKYIVAYRDPSAGQASWSVIEGDGEFAEVNPDSTLISGIPENKNVYRLTVSNGTCEPRMANLTVNRKKVHLFDGISPTNEDGINDILVGEGLDNEDVEFTFEVFSTSGLLVRKITGKDIDQLGFRRGLPNNGLEIWDGKGSVGNGYVPPGVYYYVLVISYKGKTYPPAKNYVVVK